MGRPKKKRRGQRPAFDPTKLKAYNTGPLFKASDLRLEYDGKTVTNSKHYMRLYKKLNGLTKTPNTKIQGIHNKNLSKRIPRIGANGRLANWAKPLQKGIGTRRIKMGVIKGEEWATHLTDVANNLPIATENFRMWLGSHAIHVFELSFKKKKFNSKGSMPWKYWAEYTRKKREKRRTLGPGLMVEYGDLRKSFQYKTEPGKLTIFTDTVPANTLHHKKESVCYAGWHNEGEGRYGGHPNAKHYVKRKFMGHSSELNPYTSSYMAKYMQVYLFHSVFPSMNK